ncbi:hypothetical protein PUN28_018797 [Cardiocondyla obscurior]|uniref:Uncharacterized protein n=1 Tax=Cardiocondyla obscurior TaxID=286306 RepID=A0AAW2EC52_9HYME
MNFSVTNFSWGPREITYCCLHQRHLCYQSKNLRLKNGRDISRESAAPWNIHDIFSPFIFLFFFTAQIQIEWSESQSAKITIVDSSTRVHFLFIFRLPLTPSPFSTWSLFYAQGVRRGTFFPRRSLLIARLIILSSWRKCVRENFDDEIERTIHDQKY